MNKKLTTCVDLFGIAREHPGCPHRELRVLLFQRIFKYALFRLRLNLSFSVDLCEHPIPIAILLVTLGLLTLLYNSSYRTINLEAGKKAQSVKYPPIQAGTRESIWVWSLEPMLKQTKPDLKVHTCNLSPGKGETAGSLRLTGKSVQPNCHSSGSVREPLQRSKHEKQLEKTPNIDLWPLHLCPHMITHAHMNTHTHTNTGKSGITMEVRLQGPTHKVTRPKLRDYRRRTKQILSG